MSGPPLESAEDRESHTERRSGDRVLLVASHGGHLAELMDIVEYNSEQMMLATYDSERTHHLPNTILMENLGTSMPRMALGFVTALRVLLDYRPEVIVSTGSEIAIPFFIAAWMLRIPTIYVESCTRVCEPTRTGRLVYYFARDFLVQSETLLPHFGNKAHYQGGLV